MSVHSLSTEALIIKRVNTGETDRVVTLFTPGQGKLVCIAKGVRKMSSSQRAYLEPGNYVKVYLQYTKSLPILTQTSLINDFSESKKNLMSMKKLVEILEIIDVLFSEDSAEEEIFVQVLSILEELSGDTASFSSIQNKLIEILVQLGYQNLHDTPYTSVLEYAASVAERPLRSYDYLTIRPT